MRDIEFKTVESRDGKRIGRVSGELRPCALGSSCLNGRRVPVTWPKQRGQTRARVTYPCTRSMVYVGNGHWKVER